ncbi:MAG: hypothetical protein ACYC6Y_03495 [Thermoguttaceae bacterium]
MLRFLLYLLTFAACMTLAVLAAFHMGCLSGVIVLILGLFLADRAGILR